MSATLFDSLKAHSPSTPLKVTKKISMEEWFHFIEVLHKDIEQFFYNKKLLDIDQSII